MKAIKGFDRYSLDERILDAIQELGFAGPTQVQARVIPMFLQKQNLIVEAPTGTGKTAAYGIPLIHHLNLLKKATQALVLIPSRELALQVSAALQSYSTDPKLHVAAVYGGVPEAESLKAIRSGAQILVAVPGRLKDMMSRYQHDIFWRDIKFLVVDEGDKLVEKGFQKEFESIRKHIRRTAVTGFFSATIPKDTETLIRTMIEPATTVRLHPKEVLRKIRFRYIEVSGRREAALAGLLLQEKLGKALIFSSRREDVYAVEGFLRNCGLKVEAYYGSQDQASRKSILSRFKEGFVDYLVATDLAARGLDIEMLPAVINLSIPDEFEYYLHRVGRTARAGKRGMVFNLVSGSQEMRKLVKWHQYMELPVTEIKVKPVKKQQLLENEGDRRVKAHLSKGKKDKIRKGDIVGFLTNQTGIPADLIGAITILDNYSMVDLPATFFDMLIAQKDNLQLKGKSIRIRKYTIEEEDRITQANRDRVRDRKKK